MKIKKAIPVILLLITGTVLLSTRNRNVIPPATETPTPSPSTLSQKRTPEPTSVKQASHTTNKKKTAIPGREALISYSSVYLEVLQTDGTIDKYHVCSDRIPADYVDAVIQSTNYVYYCLTSSATLFRIPIQQQEDKIKLLPKNIESLGTIESTDFIYATDQYVIYEGDECLVQLNVQTKEKKELPAPSEENDSLYWSFIYDCNKKLLIDRDSNFYIVEINDKKNKRTFFKINTDTWQKSKLSGNTNAVFLDTSGQIVCMESDKKGNYAYYPKTGKRVRCGSNMFRKWAAKKEAHEFVTEEIGMYFLPIATNRDLVDWIQKKNPWSYQQKKGRFECMNYFIYKDRMYVKVRFIWIEPGDEDVEDDYFTCYTEGTLLFSYSLKNYNGIRPEKKINRIMQNTSEKTYGGSDDDEHGGAIYTVTGDFTFLFEDTLVFAYNKYDDKHIHYGLYNLDTHQYKKVKKKNGDSMYLNWLLM